MHPRQFTVLAVLAFGLWPMLQAQDIYIRDFAGYQSSYTIDDLAKITFSDGNIIFNEAGGTVSTHSLSETRFVNFVDIGGAIEDGVEDFEPGRILLYPNPAISYLNLKLPEGMGTELQVAIVSIDGKVLFTKHFSASRDITLDTSFLSPGLYLCNLLYDVGMTTIKFTQQ